jgi:hypothetical protein
MNIKAIALTPFEFTPQNNNDEAEPWSVMIKPLTNEGLRIILYNILSFEELGILKINESDFKLLFKSHITFINLTIDNKPITMDQYLADARFFKSQQEIMMKLLTTISLDDDALKN